jgi:hypothetical protein
MAVKAGWEDLGNGLVRNTKVYGGVVDVNNPMYTNYQEQPTTGGGIPGAQGGPASTVQQQAGNAATYSSTPGAAPSANTSNQGTQDVVRNSYLQQATQGTKVDLNDPNFKQQIDTFNAGSDRARREYQSQAAERLSAQGLGNSGAMQNERRLSDEQAATSQGAFQAQLVSRELENRRNEIKDALTNLRGIISGDQAMALQKQLADLDAAIKREGLSQSGTLGAGDLALRDKLGTGALNMDLLRALLQNQQFGTDAGIRIGDLEARYGWQ